MRWFAFSVGRGRRIKDGESPEMSVVCVYDTSPDLKRRIEQMLLGIKQQDHGVLTLLPALTAEGRLRCPWREAVAKLPRHCEAHGSR